MRAINGNYCHKEKRIFTVKSEWERGKKQGSHEYLLIISLDVLNLDRQKYLARSDKIRKDPGEFDLVHSACGQKIYELITGENIGSYKSPQSAAVQGVLDTLKEGDDFLRNNLANSLINSGLSAAAYDLGKKHDESKLELSKSTIESTSDYQRWRP